MSADAPEKPTDLTFVGPATATVFDAAPFEARDVAERRVSYRELVDAGIAFDVADRLRREYSLVWSFEWTVGGTDLAQRAAQVSGLGASERAWIAESASGNGEVDDSAEFEPATAPEVPAEEDCPRCDGRVEIFVMGDSETSHCVDCGYVGVDSS